MPKYRFPKGAKPAVKCTFTDPEDTSAPVDPVTGKTLIDPGTVTAEVKPPTGSTTLYTYGVDAALTRDSVGKFRLVFELTLAGAYHVKWTGIAGSRKAVEYSTVDSFTEAGL